MEPIYNVEREVDCVINNFNEFTNYTQDSLTNLVTSIENLKDDYTQQYRDDMELTDGQVNTLNSTIRKIKDVLESLGTQHKKIHMSVSKLGKTIDKNFCRETQASSEEDFFINLSEVNKFTLKTQQSQSQSEDEQMEDNSELDRLNDRLNEHKFNQQLTPSKQLRLINKAILQHFLRMGQCEVASELMNEAQINVEDTIKWPFNELNVIVESLKKWDLDPALKWALDHEEQLNKRNSVLIFKLYKLKFIEMLKKISQQIEEYKESVMQHQNGSSHEKEENEDTQMTEDDSDIINQLNDISSNGIQTDAYIAHLEKELISFARTNLQPYFNKYSREIQQLMCCLLYLPSGIRKCPYRNLFNIQESEVVDLFTREACSLLGLSVESPLIVTFNAGCKALPALINIRQVMQQRKVTNVWNCRDELPIGIDLGKEKQYHSIFSCPILKEQSKDSNPPMRLTCGHVISKDALNKLAIGSKLKCPYCPIEQNPSDAKQIVF